MQYLRTYCAFIVAFTSLATHAQHLNLVRPFRRAESSLSGQGATIRSSNDPGDFQPEGHYIEIQPDSVRLAQLFAARSEHILLVVPSGIDSERILDLEKVELFGPRLPVSEHTADGVREAGYESGVYYRTQPSGEHGLVATLSLFRTHAVVQWSDATGNYVLAPFRNRSGGCDPRKYVMYNDRDMNFPLSFECHQEELVESEPTPFLDAERSSGDCKLAEMYFECDYEMYQDLGSNTTQVLDYLTAVFNQVAAVYAIHDINLAIQSVLVWTTPDGYPTNSSLDALLDFQGNQVHVADYHHLLSTTNNNLGGIAYVGDGICNTSENGLYYNYAYSNIYTSYQVFPIYSWTVMVIAHENGHNMGSHHTHWCGWPGGRLDNCGPTAGYFDGESCPNGPTPTVGTVMSYCHLIGGIGIDLSLGFGTWPNYGPTNAILDEYLSNTCFSNPVLDGFGATATTSVCAGGTIQLSASAYENALVEWFGPNGYYSAIPTNTLNNVGVLQSGMYKTVASYMDCHTDTIYKNVVVIPPYSAPSSATATPAIVNEGQVSLLTVGGSLAPGTSWKWYNGACGSAYIGQGSSVGVTVSLPSTYYVRAEGSCGSSPCFSVSVQVYNTDCPGDLTFNGVVDIADLLAFLGTIGCTGDCIGDFSNDQLVNTLDLLLFLAYYGQICP